MSVTTTVKLRVMTLFICKVVVEDTVAVRVLGNKPVTPTLQVSILNVPVVVVMDNLSVLAGDGGERMLFICRLNTVLVGEENNEVMVTCLVAVFPVHPVLGSREEEHVIED